MKIIHQIWFDFGTGQSPSESDVTVDFIARTNPHYQYLLWDLKSSIKFIRENYPEYTRFITQETNRNIIKCDFFRYLLMLHFGGYYFDLDFILLQNLDNFDRYRPKETEIVLTEECYNSMDVHNTLHNGFLYSKESGHMFWRRLCDEIVNRESSVYTDVSEAEVYHLTGTKFLYQMYRSYGVAFSEVLPFFLVCTHWFTDEVSGEKCVYTRGNEKRTIHGQNCGWTFLTLDEVSALQESLINNHAVAICALLPHGSLWKF